MRRATGFAGALRTTKNYFYPRSPCGERLLTLIQKLAHLCLFLSTLSLRRATYQDKLSLLPVQKISIHALLAESDDRGISSKTAEIAISIHALLAESDKIRLVAPDISFISIHALLAESDYRTPPYNLMIHISIHALLAESDIIG